MGALDPRQSFISKEDFIGFFVPNFSIISLLKGLVTSTCTLILITLPYIISSISSHVKKVPMEFPIVCATASDLDALGRSDSWTQNRLVERSNSSRLASLFSSTNIMILLSKFHGLKLIIFCMFFRSINLEGEKVFLTHP